jgi:AraC-like DNA-binding protein/putative Mn2+ efflux pump MntP
MLYVKSIFLPQKGLIKKNKRHFIFPIIYLFFITLPILISLYTKAYLYDYIKIYENYLSLAILYSLVYCIISLHILKKAQEVIKHNYSSLEGVDISWIKRLLIGGIFIISIDILSSIYELSFGVLKWNTLYLTSICLVFIVIYLGYHGVLQSKIFISPFFLQKENHITFDNEIKKPTPPNNYSKSELVALKKQLNTLMHDQKLFLDEKLSLKSLAELLAISDKKLSAILNQHMQISFYDYVNGFRVEDVINKMKDSSYDKYTLLAIAFESGFNSKTSFNRIFKKATNLSPSEYKKQLQ